MLLGTAKRWHFAHMLQSITLRFTDSPDLELPAAGITVFVGPNNSGTSLVLREVESALTVHPFPTGLRILKDYEVRWQSRSKIEAFIEKSKGAEQPNPPLGQISIARLNPNGGLEQAAL